MLSKTINQVLKEIARDIERVWKMALDSQASINPKVGLNTLNDSTLKVDTETVLQDNIILFSYNEYAEYIETGRRPKVRKVPIEALRQWANKRGIPTDNDVLYAIREGIYRDGISPRPIMTKFSDLLDKGWDERYADEIFEKITEALEEHLK